MEMARHGAAAHHGTKKRNVELSVKWRESDETLQLYSKHRVSDFNSSSDYYYYFNISVAEIKGIISFLSKKSNEFDDDTALSLRSVVPDIVRLANILSMRQAG
jgi:hypothetical protein